MMRTLRALFLARSLREEILVVALAFILVGWWLSGFADRAGRFLRESRHTTAELANQAQWLANRTRILDAAQTAASRFDASSTLNSTGLLTAVNALAEDAGLANTRGDADADESNGQFSVHTLRFEIPRADWSSLTGFYLELEKRHPYIGIEQFSISADKTSHTHNVSMVLSSFEIIR